MSQTAAIQSRVKTFLLEQFLPDEDPANLAESTPLISAGILDSIATLQLVAFLEETFGIKVEAHEASVDNLNTLGDIARFVAARQGAAGR
jgi:acyl carrier protein